MTRCTDDHPCRHCTARIDATENTRRGHYQAWTDRELNHAADHQADRMANQGWE